MFELVTVEAAGLTAQVECEWGTEEIQLEVDQQGVFSCSVTSGCILYINIKQ